MELDGRIHYDETRQLLLLDFRHLKLRRPEDVERIREAVSCCCEAIGHKVAAVVNYHGFQLDESVAERYATIAHEMQSRYYERVTRYAGGAFRRMRLARLLSAEIESGFLDDKDGQA